jgi:mRNA interferase MazF
MKEGDILLAAMPQADGNFKERPVLLYLRRMPPFDDLLLCGISSQLQHAVAGFDELIRPGDADFPSSGLKSASLIRAGFLSVLPRGRLQGRIGYISTDRLNRLLSSLAEHLRPNP